MSDFPLFMKGATNRIASSSQHTPGVEGYVFDGADECQMREEAQPELTHA